MFLSTHPGVDERIASLEALALRDLATGGHGITGRGRYMSVIGRIRPELLRDELRQRRYAQTQFLLARLLEAGVERGEIEHHRGELFRLRAAPGDEERAVSHYTRALAAGGFPPETYRELGLIHHARREVDQAGRYLSAYLQRKPDAPDRLMIEAYLEGRW